MLVELLDAFDLHLLDLLGSRLAGLVDLQQLLQHGLGLVLRKPKLLEKILHHRQGGLVQFLAFRHLELVGLRHLWCVVLLGLAGCIGRLLGLGLGQIAKQATAIGRRRSRFSSWRGSRSRGSGGRRGTPALTTFGAGLVHGQKTQHLHHQVVHRSSFSCWASACSLRSLARFSTTMRSYSSGHSVSRSFIT
ncbi:hypothetical protein D3C84_853230 [compost metagenome]